MAKKTDRADVVLAEQGLVESCEKATRMIMEIGRASCRERV